jgi:putative ABC transport system permease protein
LGAAPRQVAGAVVRRALILTLVGIAAGLAIASALARFAGAVVYEVRPLDPRLMALVSAGVVLVAAVASYLPARRAAAVDPATALRLE